ncbi:GtrA domain-containing protein [[Clostridium] fimetarium]|uniref:GtrA-like protein n=1 Tax=[Clostridium] fimetarium TaxID=99656 RepID=A0A1I0R9D1_9FIRM|nr:GtrA family protein [[Clostridium] fimetarium]SEW37357.1 GtrA-like protein [[Clostridium] fimetarium]
MKKLLIQMLKFFGISGIGWLMDFTIYNLLSLKFTNLSVNNMLSSLVGVSFVFIYSTRKTFIQKAGGIDLKLKFIIYIVYQIVLILLMSYILSCINDQILEILTSDSLRHLSAMFAKILITPITMILNFIVIKQLIERL